MSIATKCTATSVIVEILYPLSGAGDLNALLELVASVVETLGGQARIDPAGEEVKWIISVPLRQTGEAPASPVPAEVRSRPLTLLLVDPNPASQRSLMEKIAQRGHRVVPAAGGGEAVEMANAIHFDAVLAIPVLPDMTWPELLERTRLVGCRSILLCDSLAPMSHALVQRGEALALRRPVDESDLDRVLLSVTPVE
jgi:CheY-like chemotaxis protein